LSSSLMIALGVVWGDLAALFWGGSFLLFLLYTVVASHLVRSLLVKRLASESLDLKLPARGVFPGDRVQAIVKTRLRTIGVPGFAYVLQTRLEWKTRQPLVLSRRVDFGESEDVVALKVRERGQFASRTASLLFHDSLGFTCGSLPLDLNESISVYPSLLPVEELRFHFEGGSETEYLDKQTKRDDLLEVRKYFPGDDSRKLNWKIFAHIGELFIREGEQAPPPRSNLLFVLDTAVSSELAPSLAGLYLDRLVELACSSMLLFLLHNSSLMLSTNSLTKVVSLGRQKEEQLLSLMASIWWTEEGSAPPLPEVKSLHAIVFSTPGSSSLGAILKSARELGWGLTLIFKNLDQSDFPVEREGPGPGLKNLLFRSESPTLRARNPHLRSRCERDLSAFKEFLLAEAMRVQEAPWRIKDVRIV
jgi:uncharacterized protein (DUF58 family)